MGTMSKWYTGTALGTPPSAPSFLLTRPSVFTIELVRDFAPIHSYGHVLPSLACAVAVPCLNIKFRTFQALLPVASQAAMARSTVSLSMHFLGVASCGRVDGAQILMSNANHYRIVQLKSYGSVAMNT